MTGLSKLEKTVTASSLSDKHSHTEGELSCSALPVSKSFFFAISKWRMASNVLPKKHLETTTTWTVTGFSVLSANFPSFR